MMLTTSPLTRAPTGYFFSMFSHGRGVLLLEAQGDLLLVLVDLEDLDLDLLIDLEHLAGVVDAAPATCR